MKTFPLIFAFFLLVGFSCNEAFSQQSELSALSQDSRADHIYQLKMPPSVSEAEYAGFMKALGQDKSIKAVDRRESTLFIYLKTHMDEATLSGVILSKVEAGGLPVDVFSDQKNNLRPQQEAGSSSSQPQIPRSQ